MVHFLIEYLWNSYFNWINTYGTAIYVSGTDVDAGITAINKTNVVPAFMELLIVNVWNPMTVGLKDERSKLQTPGQASKRFR